MTEPKLVPAESGIGYLDADSKKALLNRLARLQGHVGAVARMVEDERCADEVLLQVAALKAALNKFAAVVIDHELKTCVDNCMTGNADERLDRVTKVLSTLLKQS